MYGYLAKVAVPTPKKTKLGPKIIDCIFIGYADNSSAYRFLIHKSEVLDMHENTIIESRNADFFEDVFPKKDRHETSSIKRTYDTTTSSNQDNEDKDNEETRRSKRVRTSKSFGLDFLTYLLENELRTYQDIMSSPEAPSLEISCQ